MGGCLGAGPDIAGCSARGRTRACVSGYGVRETAIGVPATVGGFLGAGPDTVLGSPQAPSKSKVSGYGVKDAPYWGASPGGW